MNNRQDKHSGNHTKAHRNQIAENQECRTNLKSSQRKKSHIFQRNKDKSNKSSCPQMVQLRRQWRNIFKVLKINNNQTEILCTVKISFKNKMLLKSKTFSSKQKLGEFITPRTALSEMLKEHTLISIMKTYENIQHTGKSKHTAKFRIL